jgi:predicted nucleic acid-binding protein
MSGFLAPDLIHAELGNVLWKKLLFQGLAAADARTVLADLRKLAFRITPTSVLLDEAFLLAMTLRRNVYDMLYLALRLRERCPLVTADDKLYHAIHPAFPNIVSPANWP